MTDISIIDERIFTFETKTAGGEESKEALGPRAQRWLSGRAASVCGWPATARAGADTGAVPAE